MAYGTNNARIDELVVLLKDLQDIARLNIVKIDILLSESMSDKSRISAADKHNPVKRKFQDNSGSSFETNKISVDYGHRSQNQTLDWGSEVPPKVRALDPYPSRPGNYQRHLEMEQRRFEEEIQPRESVGTRHSTSEYDVNKNSKTGRKGGNLGLSLLQQYEDDADADAGDADIRRSDQHSATNTYGSQARSQSNVYGYSTPNIFSVPPPPLPVKNVKMPVGILKKSSTSGPNGSTNTYKQGYSNQSPVSNQNIGIASSGSQYGYPVSSAVGSSSMSYSNQGPSSSSAVQQNLHSNPPPLSLGDFFVTKVIIGDFMIEKLAPLPKTKIVPFPHLNIGGITAKIRLQCNIVKGYEDILILVGANDIQNTSLTEMIINLKTLIAVIQMINSSAHIFISSMIPRNQENRLVNRKIEQYNSQLDGEFNDEKVTYLQTCKKFQSMAKPVPGYFEMDGIHLNGHGLKVLHGYFGNVLL